MKRLVTLFFLSMAVFSFFGAPSNLHSQPTTYTYTGNNFTFDNSPQTTSMSVSGWFQMNNPIPPSTPFPTDFNGAITRYSFFDSVQTLTDNTILSDTTTIIRTTGAVKLLTDAGTTDGWVVDTGGRTAGLDIDMSAFDFDAEGTLSADINESSLDYSTTIIAEPSLSAYWQMNGDWKDSKGTNHGTGQWSATWDTGDKIDGSASGYMDYGTASYVSIGNIVSGTTFSIDMWVKLDADASSWVGLFTTGDDGFYLKEADNNIFRMDYFVSGSQLSNTDLVPGVWYHVGVSVNAGSGTFYLNGVADGTFTDATGRTFNSIAGQSGAEGAGHYDEIAYYTSALSGADFLAHHNSYVVPYGELRIYNSSNGIVKSYLDGSLFTGSSNYEIASQADIADSATAVDFDWIGSSVYQVQFH
jgi:hypothetical protein